MQSSGKTNKRSYKTYLFSPRNTTDRPQAKSIKTSAQILKDIQIVLS